MFAATGGSGYDDRRAQVRRVADFGRIPLGFQPNRGQSERGVEFVGHGRGFAVFLRRRQVVLALGRPSAPAVVRMVPMGASPRVRPRPAGRLARRTSYLTAGAKAGRSLPSYRRVVYEDVYPGIDLVLRGDQRALEYDFVVAPGADPADIALGFRGGGRPRVARDGALVTPTRAGRLRQRPPVVYQRMDGRRHRVEGRFSVRGRRVGFALGPYDRSRPLVIDPVVEYATFLGGGGYDSAEALAIADDGSAYVGGATFAADFPTTPGAFDRDAPPSGCAPGQDPGDAPPPEDSCHSDAFVAKLAPDGGDLVFSTFLGGNRRDRVQGLAIDGAGAVYIAGGTDSSDFPTTPDAADATAAGERRRMGLGLVVLGEPFVAKLSPDGSRLEYSTFLGGADADEAMDVVVDPRGRAHVTGHTFSDDFPVSRDAYDSHLNTEGAPPSQCSDMFVARVRPDGHGLEYSTLFGGSRLEFSWGLDIDGEGAAYVLGESMSDDAPTTPGAFQREHHVHSGPEIADCAEPLEHAGDADLHVVKLDADGKVEYATGLGGDGHEHGLGIAVHGGAAHIAGHTTSKDFPTTPGAYDRTPSGGSPADDAFALKLSRDGARLEYSTLLGGSDADWALDVDVDGTGGAYLTGFTASRDFPLTPDALDPVLLGPGSVFYDAFLTRLAPDGSRLLYSSYLGGSGPDVGVDVVADGRGSAYVAGLTFSPDLPATPGAHGPLFGGPVGYSDAFLARFSGFPVQASATPPRLRLAVRPRVVEAGKRVRFAFRVRSGNGGRPVRGAVVRLRGARARTGPRGRASLRARFASTGVRRVVARKPGFRRGETSIRVVDRR